MSQIVKITSYLMVGFLWGTTNAYIKHGAVEECPEKKNQANIGYIAGVINTLKKILRPRVFIPLALNQMGSVLFYYMLATDDVSIAVPVANSLTFAFTAISSWYLGERIIQPLLLLFGLFLVVLGISLCVATQSIS